VALHGRERVGAGEAVGAAVVLAADDVQGALAVQLEGDVEAVREDAQGPQQVRLTFQGHGDLQAGGARVEVHGLAWLEVRDGEARDEFLFAAAEVLAVGVALVLAVEGGAAVHLADQAAFGEQVEVAADGAAAAAGALLDLGGAQGAPLHQEGEDALEAFFGERRGHEACESYRRVRRRGPCDFMKAPGRPEWKLGTCGRGFHQL